MFVFECKIDKESKETLLVEVINDEKELPLLSWTGFMKNYTDWDTVGTKMNEEKEKKCSIYVLKSQLRAYIVSNFAFPVGQKLKFAHLGGLIA